MQLNAAQACYVEKRKFEYADSAKQASVERENEKLIIEGDKNDNLASLLDKRNQPMCIAYSKMGDVCAHFINSITMINEKTKALSHERSQH